ncbi:amidohydrolase [Streptomyces sp. LHD-70]|uniref:amidohydrolase n=1 Tax=Streptomyces sp. LHD-70 TaxID=3072140 RepID=UPI00280DD363|nr:amidohydrolase [Streptomyces sp. LHD-70]MDQ8701142.1 amidohydrolase [Streptomyces sp. LHD-70]
MSTAPSTAATAHTLAADHDHPAVLALYEELHRHPELSHAEHTTAARVAKELRALGVEVTENVGGTGVVGVLENGPGRTVLARADMDALPVQEATGLAYASRVDGLMHACGHDMHTAMLIGAAQALARGRQHWSGTVLFVFQPAEETGEGALAMRDDGLLKRFPCPDVLLAQHVSAGPAGLVAHVEGPVLAASTSLDVVINGRGGHGSRPDTTIDPIVIGAAVVGRVQSIVAREIAPRQSAVVTVGRFHSGTANNVIPATAELGLSVRSASGELQDQIVTAIRRIVTGECAAAGTLAEPEIRIVKSMPATVNDPRTARRIAQTHREMFGAARIIDPGAAMGSEDFSELAVRPDGTSIPYHYWFLPSTLAPVWDAAPGTSLEEKFAQVPSAHSPHFAPDPAVLGQGVAAMTGAVLTELDQRT